jgi:hypothetical protein
MRQRTTTREDCNKGCGTKAVEGRTTKCGYNYNKAVEATYCDKAVSEKETRGLHPAAC